MSLAAPAGAAGHVRRLYLPSETVVHRLPGHLKLVAALGFVCAVVATPRERFWAFGAHALALGTVVAIARIPVRTLLGRMTIEIPFVAFALLLPVLSTGPRVDVLGMALSVDGLLAAWNILAKATLGLTTSIVLSATTDVRDLLAGLARLRTPPLIVQIAGFMIRYGDVVVDETRRMRIARESRGFVARDLRQLATLSRAVAAMFIRVYERGERVHLAMLSRGYTGQPPGLAEAPATGVQWATALSLPMAAAAVAAACWIVS